MYQSISHSEGQNLIVGTTGSGKTRLFDLLISQAIMRNEAVIIIDPKGDKEMKENARIACEASGNPGRFVQFHPAFPEESARIDPLRNFTRANSRKTLKLSLTLTLYVMHGTRCRRAIRHRRS